jgi:SAM-dependent methyltransferase
VKNQSKANFYDTHYYGAPNARNTSKPLNANELREVNFYKSLYLPKKGERVLDVGCGTGNYLRSVESCEADLWGVDISKHCTDIAKAFLKKPEQILCGDALPLPFPDNHFDVVVTFGSAEHFEDVTVIFKEMHRVLRSGGHAVIMVPNMYYYKFVWETFRSGQGPVCHQSPEHLYAFQEWKRFIEGAGFVILKRARHNKFNKPKIDWLRSRLIPFYFSNHFAFVCTKN